MMINDDILGNDENLRITGELMYFNRKNTNDRIL